jgi:hypothetical protein
MSPFAKGGARSAMKNRVIALLKGFFDRFYDISGGVFYDDTKAE